ncbi:response regulator transcription factor [Candidatus Shapirobacteria bacterium]|nr:response regulator transcription factor [Candidatus Shapirobacteria bacterium]
MRILVVEDEHRIANTIKKGLELEHYAVDVAYDGIEGYDLASSGDHDLIILDLMLPGKDGLKICAELRANKIQTPILILTAKGQTQDKVKGLNMGADDYLTKPFAFEELLARIKALSRRPKTAINQMIEVADLKINTTTYEVKNGNKIIELSKKEYALLECLARHANKILSKDQIMNQVWNYEADILPNTVEVYIKKLRNKLGEKVIKTVRGFGYKLES